MVLGFAKNVVLARLAIAGSPDSKSQADRIHADFRNGHARTRIWWHSERPDSARVFYRSAKSACPNLHALVVWTEKRLFNPHSMMAVAIPPKKYKR